MVKLFPLRSSSEQTTRPWPRCWSRLRQRAILTAIRELLDGHNKLEEGPAGVYETCEELVGAEVDALLGRLRAVPEVPVAPHFDGPRVQEHIASLLKARATPE